MSEHSNNGDFHALVIDDEKQVREFVSAVLRDEGWKLSQSPSAEDAFARVGLARDVAITVPSFTAAAMVAASTDLVAGLPQRARHRTDCLLGIDNNQR